MKATSVGYHYVPQVGIYTSASALPAEKIDFVLTAVFEIDFSLYYLVSSEYDGRGNLPGEKCFVAAFGTGQLTEYPWNILFHGQIENEQSLTVIRQNDVNHVEKFIQANIW